MKNTLKLLLCTMCCAMVFNNCGYSMQGMNDHNNNNIININIEDIDINTNPEVIKNLANQLRINRIQSNNNQTITLKEVFNQYNSLSDVLAPIYNIPNEKVYAKYLNTNGNNFAGMLDNIAVNDKLTEGNNDLRMQKLVKEKHINEIISKLLRDNLRFISEYSPSTNQEGFYPFSAAWDILYRYAEINNLEEIMQKIKNITSTAKNLGIHVSNIAFTQWNNIKSNIDITFSINITTDSIEDISSKIISSNTVSLSKPPAKDFNIDNILRKTMEIANPNCQNTAQLFTKSKIQYGSIIEFLDKKLNDKQIVDIINTLLNEYLIFKLNCNIYNSPVAYSILTNAWKKITYYVILKCNKQSSQVLQHKFKHLIKKQCIPFFYNGTLDYQGVLQEFISDVNNEIKSVVSKVNDERQLQFIFNTVLKILKQYK